MIPLDTGINVGNNQTITLEPKSSPELVSLGIRDAPIEGIDRSLGDSRFLD